MTRVRQWWRRLRDAYRHDMALTPELAEAHWAAGCPRCRWLFRDVFGTNNPQGEA